MDILEPQAARAVGLEKDDLLLWMHTGSNSLGKRLENYYTQRWDASKAGRRWRQYWRRARFHLGGAPVGRWGARSRLIRGLASQEGLAADSPEGRRYLLGHRAAMNFAVANRLVLAGLVREALTEIHPSATMSLLIDVAHESIRQETIKGETLWVHRNGASRAVPPGAWEDPWKQGLGQWLPLPGSLGSDSYLAMTEAGVQDSCWAVNHGAGRVLEKPDARRRLSDEAVEPYRAWQGQRLFYAGKGDDLAEQIPAAFKDIGEVVRAVEGNKLGKLVARAQPIASLKS